MKTLICLTVTLFVFCLSSNLEANSTMENNFILRAGMSLNFNRFETDRLIDNQETEDGEIEDETETFSAGLATSIAYRWSKIELAMASDVVFGNVDDLTFKSKESSIRGEGRFRLVNISPQIKFITHYTLFNKASFYIGFGPAWSLQTFIFSRSQSTGNFNNKKRVNFENYGGGLFIGLEEILAFKEEHPAFIEIGYNYMHSYKVSIVDASNSVDVLTLSESDSNDFSGRYLIVRLGFTLF